MNDVKITVGGAIEDDASRGFVDAWHRAARGETFRERHLAFESWDALARVLTGKRMELLRYVRRHKVKSVRALAKALGRDYSNVHADVQALSAVGLLEAEEGSLRADYDAIETKIAISDYKPKATMRTSHQQSTMRQAGTRARPAQKSSGRGRRPGG